MYYMQEIQILLIFGEKQFLDILAGPSCEFFYKRMGVDVEKKKTMEFSKKFYEFLWKRLDDRHLDTLEGMSAIEDLLDKKETAATSSQQN